MKIRQISILIDNKAGAIKDALNVLKDANIQIITSNIADTFNYGIYRIICSDPEKAHKVLLEAKFNVTIGEIYALKVENKVGEAANIISLLTSNGVNIAYLYSFMLRNEGILIFNTYDSDRANEVIQKNNVQILSEKELFEVCLK